MSIKKWSDVKNTIWAYMEASSLDMESQKIKLLYETICKEIDDKVARSEEANKLLKKIQDRDIAKDTAWNDLGNTLRKGV